MKSRTPQTMAITLARAIYEALGAPRPVLFVGAFALAGALLFGVSAWLIVLGAQKKLGASPPSSTIPSEPSPASPITPLPLPAPTEKRKAVIQAERHEQPGPQKPEQPGQDQPRLSTSALEIVGGLANRGSAIQDSWIRTNDTDTLATDYAKWIKEADVALKSIDPSYAIQFQHAHGHAMMGCPDGHSVRGCGYWQEIQGKNAMLMSAIADIRGKR